MRRATLDAIESRRLAPEARRPLAHKNSLPEAKVVPPEATENNRSVFSGDIKDPYACRMHVFIVSGGHGARVMKEHVELGSRSWIASQEIDSKSNTIVFDQRVSHGNSAEETERIENRYSRRERATGGRESERERETDKTDAVISIKIPKNSSFLVEMFIDAVTMRPPKCDADRRSATRSQVSQVNDAIRAPPAVRATPKSGEC